ASVEGCATELGGFLAGVLRALRVALARNDNGRREMDFAATSPHAPIDQRRGMEYPRLAPFTGRWPRLSRVAQRHREIPRWRAPRVACCSGSE
ncbi:MAG: hypothetical protein K8R89_02720, partial [Anaerolineae bacterium]|nr:hypothetical protein [Anaerolineae bacterium]